jgi:hypothetical protein
LKKPNAPLMFFISRIQKIDKKYKRKTGERSRKIANMHAQATAEVNSLQQENTALRTSMERFKSQESLTSGRAQAMLRGAKREKR